MRAVIIAGALLLFCALMVGAYALGRIDFSLTNQGPGMDNVSRMYEVRIGQLRTEASWVANARIFASIPPPSRRGGRQVQILFVSAQSVEPLAVAKCKLRISPLDTNGLIKPFLIERESNCQALTVFLDLGVRDILDKPLQVENLVIESD